MGLGLFKSRRKASLSTPTPQHAPFHDVQLRVLVDCGPNARDMFIVRVSPDAGVAAIRQAVAAEIGVPSMSLFKVNIPWQAHYEAGAYLEHFGVTPSLLSVFPGWNLDDPSQLAASGGLAVPAYVNGSGSLRSANRQRRRGYLNMVAGGTWPPSGVASSSGTGAKSTVAHWFPDGGEPDNITILARTASCSSLDWTRGPSVPITLSARFAAAPGEPATREGGGTVLVEITPESTVAELKVALLLAGSRPAPAGMLDALVLWRVDVSGADLAAIDAAGGLTRGRRPTPYPPTSTPPLLLADDTARVADYFPGFLSRRTDPTAITISAWINPLVATSLAPRAVVPPFQYPMPTGLVAPLRQRLLGPAPLPPSTVYLESPTQRNSSIETIMPFAQLRCCADGHHGHSGGGLGGLGGGGGLVGLGIILSPPLSVSDHGSSDDEAISWPATPNVGADNGADWLGPSPTTRCDEWDDAHIHAHAHAHHHTAQRLATPKIPATSPNLGLAFDQTQT